MNTATHWEQIHAEKKKDVSWWQERASLWFDLIDEIDVSKDAAVIDVGGGSSLLVDELLNHGFTDVTLLDIAQPALEQVKSRVGDKLTYICQDITTLEINKTYSLWHDRAVFHFLTQKEAQEAYRNAVKNHTAAGSWVILSTFALDGPDKCSGLDVQRYSEEQLAQALGKEFKCQWTERRTHTTPWQTEQKFVIAVFRRE